ncbi:T9SS type A sorting domain-containing protein, partial [Sphingobacteriales bacterium CHB3]|nr:T9SS type A sorting domain-containing protein [Sphingobacteriales bacterium CHB3]
NQLGGTGRFKLYRNQGGRLDSIPFWTSSFSGYGSGINLADIDYDGDRDLITGGWWNPLRIYTNQNGSFTSTPQWTSATNSVVEAIVFGDYDNDGLDTLNLQFVSDGQKKLYYLPRAPIQRILRLTWNGDPDSVAPYCYDLENGWISFSLPAGPGTLIDVRAVVSHDLDFAVSNWDNSIGNYVFKNTITVSVGGENHTLSQFRLYQNYPNPFNPSTHITYEIESSGLIALKVYDLLGRQIAILVNEEKPRGVHTIQWKPQEWLSSGVYLIRLEASGRTATTRMVLLR